MRIAGWSLGRPEARLAILPAVAVVGCSIWLLLPQASDAESHSASAQTDVSRLSQSRTDITAATLSDMVPSADPGEPGTSSPAALPTDVAPASSPLDGLKLVSQSWRRGGLGSKALVTFTLRNTNVYAVKDIEIACRFARRDGRHLTDRRRIIPDTVNMKSRKRYAGMLVGFVNVNANKARCSLVTASRI